MSGIALPEGTRLLHIGPHKTGTTAIQRALHKQREELTQQGIHYTWPTTQAYRPAIGLVGGGQRGSNPADPADWAAFIKEVDAAGDQTVVASSESFSNATPEHIARIREDLGPRLHVVRMVRRYDKLIASQWQQLIAGGSVPPFRLFLKRVLSEPDHMFWRRHGFGQQTRPWVEALGADRVSVVVVNESDHSWLLRVMERMLSLEPEFLHATSDPANRSLTPAETETMRQLAIDIRQLGWSERTHFIYVRNGLAKGFRELPADPEAGRLKLPAEALDRLAEATREGVADLRDLGMQVVGDLDWLTLPPTSASETPTETGSPTLSMESAARGAAGIVERGQRIDKRIPIRDQTVEPSRTLTRVDSAAAALAERKSGPTSDGRFVLLAPWADWALGWQRHLLARGNMDFETWVASHRDDQADALHAWLADGGSPRNIQVGDAPDLIDWAGSQLVQELVRIGHEKWDDDTWVETVDRGFAAALFATDGPLTPTAPWIAATSEAAEEAVPRLVEALPRLKRAAARRRLLPATDAVEPSSRIDARRAADAYLGGILALDEDDQA